PGLGFAGLALIPFHDPSTVKPLIERALDRKISQATRWCFFNAAPYILAMGDVMYDGEGNLDRESTTFAKELIAEAESAAQGGLGRHHAKTLRKLYDENKAKRSQDPEFGLALWHQSAYLLGTLDLRDEAVLSLFLDPKHGDAFNNVMSALSFASNRDFLAD